MSRPDLKIGSDFGSSKYFLLAPAPEKMIDEFVSGSTKNVVFASAPVIFRGRGKGRGVKEDVSGGGKGKERG